MKKPWIFVTLTIGALYACEKKEQPAPPSLPTAERKTPAPTKIEPAPDSPSAPQSSPPASEQPAASAPGEDTPSLPPASPAPPEVIPTAKPVEGKPGFVFSPYNDKVVDVRDLAPGTLVADPSFPASEKKHFRTPP